MRHKPNSDQLEHPHYKGRRKASTVNALTHLVRNFRLPHTPIALLILIVVIILFFYSPFAPLLILSVCLAYGYFARKFSVIYIDSRLLLFVITLFTHTAVLGLLVIICSAFANLNLHTVICLELLLFILLYGYEFLRYPTEQVSRQFASKVDVVSLVLGVVAVFLLSVVPLANLSVQKEHSSVLALITGNVDYGTHLALFNDYLGFGSVQTWNAGQPARSDVGGFYPASWHAANAAVTNVVAPHLRPGQMSAIALGFINVFWLGILVFLIAELAFKLYTLIGQGPGKTPAVYIVMTLMLLAVFYFFIVHLQRFGFFSFTPQLIAILLLVYTLHQLMHEGIGATSALGLAVLYCSISLAAWILLLPVAGGAVLIGLAMSISKKRLNRADLLSELSSNWPLYLIAFASIAAQFWVLLTVKSPEAVGLKQGLLLGGGTPIYDPLIYIALFAGLVAAIIVCRNRRGSKPYEPVLIVVTATLIFTCLLFAFQTYFTGTVHYYYLKSLLLLPIVLAPIAVAMVGTLVKQVREPTVALMIAIIIPIALVQLLPGDTGMVEFMHGSRIVPSPVNDDMWAEMHQSAYPTKRIAIYLLDSNETSDTATIIVQANRPHSRCFTTLRTAIMVVGINTAVQNFTASPLPRFCDGYHVVFKLDPARAAMIGKNHFNLHDIEVISG